MATPTPSKVIQIVDHVKGKRTEFYEQDLSKLVADNCIQKNVHYPVFSIIGARSSGKSTLMNVMFKTKFAALNQSRGIKIDEIGQNHGGSIPLLRIVLQERLNHVMHKLKVVFVVRDYNDKISKEKLHAKLTSMLVKIWGEKFPKNKSSNISDYFEITVEFLPNLDYCGKKEFGNRCAEIRNRNVNDFVAQHYTCPVEEFPRHANILWDNIKQNRRLNMPSYWAITSSNRCKAMSDELLSAVKQVISQGYKKLPQQSKDDLNKMTEWLGDILKSTITAYDDAVKCYHKETAKAFKEELKSHILLNAKPCFKQALDNYEITFGSSLFFPDLTNQVDFLERVKSMVQPKAVEVHKKGEKKKQKKQEKEKEEDEEEG
ncbi:hypothetical protein GUJ93_ZPchr0010g10960 [Zizania palustris]|uniref:Uncharacterized protein n=1 Tax=Zizania palustris TaxID=103762 RepID=A0A8J5W798_ZIZPA|nr:hypothetical protein GUJ93_ZPchr0010g10960 [Zizania palustris]